MKLLDRIWKKIIGLGTGEIGGCEKAIREFLTTKHPPSSETPA